MKIMGVKILYTLSYQSSIGIENDRSKTQLFGPLLSSYCEAQKKSPL